MAPFSVGLAITLDLHTIAQMIEQFVENANIFLE